MTRDTLFFVISRASRTFGLLHRILPELQVSLCTRR